MNCVQLQSISINPVPIPSERNKPIESEVSRLVFLGFNFDNDFLNELPEELKKKCPDGKIKGIVTKFETVHYFLFHKYVIKAKGYCVK